MVAAAEQAGVTLMVGYPKRYDPAFARLPGGDRPAERTAAAAGDDAGVADPALHRALPAKAARHHCPAASPAALASDSEGADRRGARPGHARLSGRSIERVLLDTLVHELNTVRGLARRADRLDYVGLAMDSVTVMLRFGELPVAIHWIDLPGIARYSDGVRHVRAGPPAAADVPLAIPARRARLLDIEDGERVGAVLAHLGGRRLRERVQARADGVPRLRSSLAASPVTSGRDGVRDIALCQAIIECFRRRAPVEDPAGVG